MGSKIALAAGVLSTVLHAGASAAADIAPPLPPVATKHPFDVLSPNGVREDDYYWLRDDTRKSADVLDYLNRENAYRDALMAPTDALQQRLYDELVGRIKPDDSTVPVYQHGYWYATWCSTGMPQRTRSLPRAAAPGAS